MLVEVFREDDLFCPKCQCPQVGTFSIDKTEGKYQCEVCGKVFHYKYNGLNNEWSSYEERDNSKTIGGHNSKEITKVECIGYLKSWSETLKDRIEQGDPRKRLYEEQIIFLDKAISELEK